MHFNCILHCTIHILCDELVYCAQAKKATEISDSGHFWHEKKKKKNHISLSREIFWEFSNKALDAKLKWTLASLWVWHHQLQQKEVAKYSLYFTTWFRVVSSKWWSRKNDALYKTIN